MKDLNQANDSGIPLHACHGYRCDEHYWAFLAHLRLTDYRWTGYSIEKGGW